MAAIDIDHRKHPPRSATADTADRKERPGPRPSFPRITVNGVVIDRKAIAAEMQNHPGDDAERALREAATALIVVAAGWLLFRATAMAVMGLFADDIDDAYWNNALRFIGIGALILAAVIAAAVASLPLVF